MVYFDGIDRLEMNEAYSEPPLGRHIAEKLSKTIFREAQTFVVANVRVTLLFSTHIVSYKLFTRVLTHKYSTISNRIGIHPHTYLVMFQLNPSSNTPLFRLRTWKILPKFFHFLPQ